jgi:site-specific DNA recombinase
MNSALLYVRVSSQDQAEEGYSLQSQEKEGEKYAERKGLKISKKWSVSESAKVQGRKAFKELIDYAKSNPEIRAIIFEKVDRMTRNFYDLVEIYDLIEKHDKEIHFFKQGLIIDRNSKSSDKLNLDIQVVLARNYINNLGEEVKKGLKAKAEQGEFPQRAPWGYLNNKETHLIDIDPDYAPLIRRMFELYATGNYSLSTLRDKMINDGLVYKTSGNKPQKSVFEHILKNPLYYGAVRWGGQVYNIGKHAPIIDKGLFETVQEMFHKKSKYTGNRRNFAFTGLLTCGTCGCSITAEMKKGRYIYYHCTGFKGGDCKKHYIPEEALKEKLGEVLKQIEIQDDKLEQIKEALRHSHKNTREYNDATITTLSAQKERIKKRLDQAYLDKLDGRITESFWQAKSKEWSDEIEILSIKINAHESSNVNYYENGVKILELAKKAYSLYKVASAEEKRKLIGIILSNCYLDGENLRPAYKKPFDLIREMADSKGKLPLVDMFRNREIKLDISLRAIQSVFSCLKLEPVFV